MYKYLSKSDLRITIDDKNYTIDHSSQIFLFKKNGRFFGTLSTNEKDNVILGKINKLINGA